MDFSQNSRNSRPLTVDRARYSDFDTSVDRGSERMGFGGTETHTDINSRDSS